MSQESNEFHDQSLIGEQPTLPERPVHHNRAVDRARELLRRIFKKTGTRNRAEEPHHREPPQALEETLSDEPEPKMPPSEHFNRQNAREMERLAEQGTPELRVLPGDQWAMHYPNGIDARNEAVERLFAGEADPHVEVDTVTPDTLFYDQNELTNKGFSTVRNRVFDVVTSHEHYDYAKFTNFISEMHGTTIDAALAQKLYNTIAYDRIRHVMLDTYHATDRARIVETIRTEMQATPAQIRSLAGMEQILAALKTNTYADDFEFVTPAIQRRVEDSLAPEDASLTSGLQESYNQYMQQGTPDAYDTLVRSIKEYYQPEQEHSHEPQQNEDQQMPPFNEEYQPPTESDRDSMRYFEVIPTGDATEPVFGKYKTVKQGYFDRASMSWKSKNVRRPYTSVVEGAQRYTIANIPAIQDAELYDIPVPDGFALDYNSFQTTGSDAKLLQDTDGCFFIQGSDVGKFTVDFLPSDKTFTNPPQTVDSIPLHSGSLSEEAEDFVREVKNADPENEVIAQKVDEFIKSRHLYPSEDELMTLQSELLSISTGDTYIQNLERSDLLDCYLGNTLAIAMLRHAGVPARIVKGHEVSDTNENMAVIDGSTGHAWSEFWDGNQWIQYDFTPDKPSDAAQEEQEQQSGNESGVGQEEKEPGEGTEAKDSPEGIRPPALPRVDNDSNLIPQSGAGEEEEQLAERDLEAAGEAIEEARTRQRELQGQIGDLDSFEGIQGMQEEVSGDEQLFNDMKDQFADALSARALQMKENMLEELENMVEDGFMSEEQEAAMREQIGQAEYTELDQVREQIATENSAYNEFQRIREEIEPLVDEWFEYFVSKLPREDVVTYDDTAVGKRGRINENALSSPGKFITGKVLSPRVMRPEIRAKFLASVVVDVSQSMVLNDTLTAYDPTKLNNAKKLVVFYNELFSRISEQYGYIKYANYAFAQDVIVIKRFEQQYNSAKRYTYEGDESSTVKARLMESLQAKDSSYTLEAVQTAADDLNAIKQQYSDYASALYFVGDGGDSLNREAQIRDFLSRSEAEDGFGDHQLHATMLGDENQRAILADIFGDRNTAVAPDFDSLIERSMEQFEDDMEDFLRGKVS